MSKAPQPSRLTWGRGWIGPYEGAFTVLMKAAWANALDRRSLCQQLFGCQIASSASLLTYVKPCVAGAIEQIRLAERPLTSFQWIQLFPMRGIERLFKTVATEEFRYCPECLSHGYQSFVFQVASLALCPIHRQELRSRCLACGAPPLHYSMSDPALDSPFRCTHCGQPLAGKLSVPAFFDTEVLHRDAQRSIGRIIRWFVSLARYVEWPMDGKSPLDWLPQVAATAAAGSRSMVAFHAMTTVLPWPLDQALIYAPPRYARTVSYLSNTALPFAPLSDPQLLADAVRPYIAIYKAIRRYIMRHHLKQHRKCIKSVQRVGEYTLGQMLVLRPDACPVAQAYLLWVRGRDAEHRDYRELRGDDPFWYWRNWVRNGALALGDRNPKRWAWDVLGSFYSTMVSVAVSVAPAAGSPDDEPDVLRRSDRMPALFYIGAEETPSGFETVAVTKIGAEQESGRAWVIVPSQRVAEALAALAGCGQRPTEKRS